MPAKVIPLPHNGIEPVDGYTSKSVMDVPHLRVVDQCGEVFSRRLRTENFSYFLIFVITT